MPLPTRRALPFAAGATHPVTKARDGAVVRPTARPTEKAAAERREQREGIAIAARVDTGEATQRVLPVPSFVQQYEALCELLHCGRIG